MQTLKNLYKNILNHENLWVQSIIMVPAIAIFIALILTGIGPAIGLIFSIINIIYCTFTGKPMVSRRGKNVEGAGTADF